MDVREKLVELQLKADIEDEVSENTTQHREYIADLMIANGVTIATDNNKWIPVTERLPEVAITHNNRWEKSTESVHVLCYCKQRSGKRMVKEGSCKVYSDGTIYWAIPGTIDSVTHWMPLPEPPKGE